MGTLSPRSALKRTISEKVVPWSAVHGLAYHRAWAGGMISVMQAWRESVVVGGEGEVELQMKQEEMMEIARCLG